MRRSLILDSTIRFVFDSVVVFSVYLLFAGHNQPGGGFVGGLLAGVALALRYVAQGNSAVRATIAIRPRTVLSLGLGLAATTAIIPLLFGDALLDNAMLQLDLPALGLVKVPSAIAFDSGVYLVVVGLVLMVFEALGDDDPAALDGAPDIKVPRL